MFSIFGYIKFVSGFCIGVITDVIELYSTCLFIIF